MEFQFRIEKSFFFRSSADRTHSIVALRRFSFSVSNNFTVTKCLYELLKDKVCLGRALWDLASTRNDFLHKICQRKIKVLTSIVSFVKEFVNLLF